MLSWDQCPHKGEDTVPKNNPVFSFCLSFTHFIVCRDFGTDIFQARVQKWIFNEMWWNHCLARQDGRSLEEEQIFIRQNPFLPGRPSGRCRLFISLTVGRLLWNVFFHCYLCSWRDTFIWHVTGPVRQHSFHTCHNGNGCIEKAEFKQRLQLIQDVLLTNPVRIRRSMNPRPGDVFTGLFLILSLPRFRQSGWLLRWTSEL